MAMGGGRIKTIVVLVMENRSFDHLLGWQTRINPELNGVRGRESNLLSLRDPNSISVPFTDTADYVIQDAPHSFQAIREQVFGGEDTSANPPPMNGFAQQGETVSPGFSKQVMSGFKPEAIPIHTTLVHEFVVFDRWFSPIPSSTQPNRQFVHSGTSHGLTSNVTKTLLAGLPQRTIFDNIYDAGLTFGIYYQQIPSTLFYRRLRQLKYINKFHQYDLDFKKNARDGKLPNYVVIEPRYYDLPLAHANDDHPTHDVREGQKLIKEVYETLRASPQWNEMLFIITYDEHGGLYDHVPTPVQNVPSPDDIIGPEPFYFKFDRLGVRVPTIMVSPWIEKGTFIHGPEGPTPSSEFEHSSIPATVKKLLNLPSNFLTKRDAWAGTFESVVLSRTTPRDDCPNKLPNVPITSPSSSTHERGIRSIETLLDVPSTPPSSSTQERRIRNLETLMDVAPLPSTLSSTHERGTGSLNDFQEDLIHLCSCLNGDSKEENYKFDTFCKEMCVKDGNAYANKALSEFFEACKEALNAGASGSAIVSLNPPVDGKRSYVLESL